MIYWTCVKWQVWIMLVIYQRSAVLYHLVGCVYCICWWYLHVFILQYSTCKCICHLPITKQYHLVICNENIYIAIIKVETTCEWSLHLQKLSFHFACDHDYCKFKYQLQINTSSNRKIFIEFPLTISHHFNTFIGTWSIGKKLYKH